MMFCMSVGGDVLPMMLVGYCDLVSLWCHIVTAVKQQMTTGTLHCRKCILLYSATEYMAAKPAQVKNASTEKIRDLYSTRLLFHTQLVKLRVILGCLHLRRAIKSNRYFL